jgi:hypothetical protein
MLTLGMVSALALVGGHAALARGLWPGERAVPRALDPDPVLRLQASTSTGIAETERREAAALREALKRAKARQQELEVEATAARQEVRSLEAERGTLRKEVKRLTRASILAAAEGEDGDDGTATPPAGPRPFQ